MHVVYLGMRVSVFFLFIILFIPGRWAFPQDVNIIRGKVVDANTSQSLVGATVVENGKFIGVVTDATGAFELATTSSFPLKLAISFLGYSSRQVEVSIDTKTGIVVALEESAIMGEEIVITASRQPQRISKAPVSISRIPAEKLSRTASPDGFALLAETKGIEYNRKGVGVVDFNMRGFNASFNARNLLLVDGRLNNLIAVGLPYLQLTSVTKTDIDQMEVALGPSSALYGFGASNGVINIRSMDPREEPGTVISAGGGSRAQRSLSVRHATKIGENSGLKVTASHLAGNAFDYTDSAYYSIIPGVAPQLGQGIPEVGLKDQYSFNKAEIGWYEGLNDEADLLLTGGFAHGTFTQTTSIGRNQFNGWLNGYVHLRYISSHWYFSTYGNWNETTNDDSRILSVLTDNYASYLQFRDLGLIDHSDEQILSSGEENRLLNVNEDGNLVELPVNSKYEDGSFRHNAEVQYNNSWGLFRFVGGMQLNSDWGDSKSTYLAQNNGEKILFRTIGVYAQGEYDIQGGFSILMAGRVDHHSLWGWQFAPKAAISKEIGLGHLRATYGRGIVAPTMLQSGLSFAGGRLLGNDEGFSIMDLDLETFETEIQTIQPLTVEKLDALELGYKGFLGRGIYVDVSAFANRHTDFITNGLTEIADAQNGRFIIAKGENPISEFQQPIYSAAVQLMGTPLFPLVESGIIPGDASTSAQIYFNFGELYTYGTDIEVRWQINRRWSSTFIYSHFDWSFDEKDPANDINGDGIAREGVDIQINAPKNRVNAIVNYDHENWFVSARARWVQKYNFFSGSTIAAAENPNLFYQGSPVLENQPVAGSYNDGPLGGFMNVDLGVSYRFEEHYMASLEVTNVFDSEVRDFVTSPVISRLINLQITVSF